MNRRTALGLLVGVVGGTAGCLGAPRAGEDEETPDPTPTDEPTRVVGSDLTRTGDCERPESASATVGTGAVRIEGCVTGPNGCAEAVLESVSLAEGRLEVVVTTESDGRGDVGCTQALVYRGYEAVVRFDGPAPERVIVVHDAPGERTTVAVVDPA